MLRFVDLWGFMPPDCHQRRRIPSAHILSSDMTCDRGNQPGGNATDSTPVLDVGYDPEPGQYVEPGERQRRGERSSHTAQDQVPFGSLPIALAMRSCKAPGTGRYSSSVCGPISAAGHCLHFDSAIMLSKLAIPIAISRIYSRESIYPRSICGPIGDTHRIITP